MRAIVFVVIGGGRGGGERGADSAGCGYGAVELPDGAGDRGLVAQEGGGGGGGAGEELAGRGYEEEGVDVRGAVGV